MKENFKVTILGASGSSSVSIKRRFKYGNNTSCVLVQIGQKDIILDMGSGIVGLIPYFKNKRNKTADILLSHFHYDHIEGFPFFTPFFEEGKFRIYSESKCDKTVKEIFEEYLRKPFFPIGLESIEKSIEFIDIKEKNRKFFIDNDIFIETINTNHPGGCISYKISYKEKSIIYMLDHEHGTEQDKKLENFARNCDLLIYDAFYFEDEFKKGWGHSTAKEGLKFAQNANIKKIVLAHHNITHSDCEFDELENNLNNEIKEGYMAYIAMEGLSFDLIDDKVSFDKKFSPSEGITIDYEKLISIGVSFSTERNVNKLLEMIISEAMRITNCDGGTIYLKIGNELHFKILHNISMNEFNGGEGEAIILPPVPITEKNVCSYVAIHRKPINIGDVYKNNIFDFTGTKSYDDINHYHTKSMLVYPLMNNRSEIIGVMQLINSLDKNGNIKSFDKESEKVIQSLASQAGVALTNALFVEENDNLLHSIVELTTTAIDQRSSYNANHTRNVARYTEMFIDYINSLPKNINFKKRFTDSEKKEIVMAARLHDAGKVSVPLNIMNKPTRLSNNYNKIMYKLKIIELSLYIDFYENRITENKKKEKLNQIKEAIDIIKVVNTAKFLNDELLQKVEKISKYFYFDKYNNKMDFFTDYEIQCLKIKKGTFTSDERNIMEGHVIRTEQLLKNITFTNGYENVMKFAIQHHEFIDGTGYPYKLKGDEITIEGRILAIIDIFEALTAKDRPYKDVISIEKAYGILENMVNNGKLDKDIFILFKKSKIGEQSIN